MLADHSDSTIKHEFLFTNFFSHEFKMHLKFFVNRIVTKNPYIIWLFWHKIRADFYNFDENYHMQIP